jgi:hypothetical protein
MFRNMRREGSIAGGACAGAARFSSLQPVSRGLREKPASWEKYFL